MAKDVEDQVVKGIKRSVYFAFQLDESTDVSNRLTVPFCFVSCDIKKLISRMSFFVALTCLVGPPAQRYRSLNTLRTSLRYIRTSISA